MCPLIAPKGSFWTGEYAAECPEHDDLDNNGCPWWSMSCSSGGIQDQVNQALKDGRSFVVGPNQPKEGFRKNYTEFDCPKANECSWQKQAGDDLCPPRYALSKKLDPRVCLF